MHPRTLSLGAPMALLLLHASLIDRWAVRPGRRGALSGARRKCRPRQLPEPEGGEEPATPAQVDALLTRVVELEARIDNLGGGANASAVVGRIGRNVFWHSARGAAAERPRAAGAAARAGAHDRGAVEGGRADVAALAADRRDHQRERGARGRPVRGGGRGSAIVGKAVGAAAAAQSAVGSAVGAASSTIGGITNVSVGTTLEKSVAVIDLGAEGVVQRLSGTGDLIDRGAVAVDRGDVEGGRRRRVVAVARRRVHGRRRARRRARPLPLARRAGDRRGGRRVRLRARARSTTAWGRWCASPACSSSCCSRASPTTSARCAGRANSSTRPAGGLSSSIARCAREILACRPRAVPRVPRVPTAHTPPSHPAAQVQKQLTKMDSAVVPVSKLSAEVASGAAAAGDGGGDQGPVDAVAGMPGSVGSAVSVDSDTGGWIESRPRSRCTRRRRAPDRLPRPAHRGSPPRRRPLPAASRDPRPAAARLAGASARDGRPALRTSGRVVRELAAAARGLRRSSRPTSPLRTNGRRAPTAAAAARAADGRDADGAKRRDGGGGGGGGGAQGLGLFVSGWDGGIPTVMPSNMMQSKRMPPP